MFTRHFFKPLFLFFSNPDINPFLFHCAYNYIVLCVKLEPKVGVGLIVICSTTRLHLRCYPTPHIPLLYGSTEGFPEGFSTRRFLLLLAVFASIALCSPSCGSDSIYFSKNAPNVSTLCVAPPVRSCALSNITAPPAIKSRVEMSLIVVFFLSLLLTSEKECDAPCMSFFARGSRHFAMTAWNDFAFTSVPF